MYFERNLAGLCELYDKLNSESKAAITWYNQVPIAKGLVSNGEKLNAVDLVYRRAADKFDFVELKTPPRPTGGNHPVYATMEILKYGLAFLLFVSKLSEIQEAGWKPVDEDETLKGWVLNAVEVNLCVLAPESYYKGFDFGWLEDQLNVGLGQLPDTPKTALNHMTFRYQALSNRHSNAAATDGLLLGLGRVSLSQDDWARLSKEASTSEGKPPKR